MNRRDANRAFDRKRQDAPGRRWYGTKGWKDLRARRLRDNPFCQRCEQRGRMVLAGAVDHVKAHKGDRDLFFAYENTQSLCPICHDRGKQSEERRGYTIGTDSSGRPLDPMHHWNRSN